MMKTLKKIRLIHWNVAEAAQCAGLINSADFDVEYKLPQGPDPLRRMLRSPADAYIIDLSRLPSQGRDLGIMLRKNLSTRYKPLIFVAGAAEKIKPIRDLLPDAAFTGWDSINAVIHKCLQRIPAKPHVPKSVFAGYSGKTLPQKLGLKDNMRIGLHGSPAGFVPKLGTLAQGVVLKKDAAAHCDLLLWFVKSQQELQDGIKKITGRRDYKSVWIIWPKKSGNIKTDLTQQTVRGIGLAAGLVDYKICSVDETWSGLLFARRKGEKNE